MDACIIKKIHNQFEVRPRNNYDIVVGTKLKTV